MSKIGLIDSLDPEYRSNFRKQQFYSLRERGLVAFKSINQLANAMGVQRSLLSRAFKVDSPPGGAHRFSESLARRIEAHFELPAYILEPGPGDKQNFAEEACRSWIDENLVSKTKELTLVQEFPVEMAGKKLIIDFALLREGKPVALFEWKYTGTENSPSLGRQSSYSVTTLARLFSAAVILGCDSISIVVVGADGIDVDSFLVNNKRILELPSALEIDDLIE